MQTAVDNPSSCMAQGKPLEQVGSLRRSIEVAEDSAELVRRLHEDGYLFLPGYLDAEQVLAARRDLLGRIEQLGWLAAGSTVLEGMPSGQARGTTLAEVARDSESLQRVLYGDRMADLFERIFGEEVRHFDYTWLRAFPPGVSSKPHMDAVFMNRGTLELLSAWTPLGDIDQTLGGLAILDGSHRLTAIKEDYGSKDVDTYCLNKESPAWSGALSDDPAALAEELDRRWLTSTFRMGDVLIFPLFTIHCGLDNNSDRLRLSCDSRYQPASQPADPRWVGIDPSRHGSRSKRGLIC